MMRFAFLALLFSALSSAALANQTTIAAPVPDHGNYDPQLSAKEAVMANWELAASGIRVGEVVGRQVGEIAVQDVSFARLTHQAKFALKTMLQRYNAATWIYASGDPVARIDGTALWDAVAATEAECVSTDCADESAALREAFEKASVAFGAAAATARDAVVARKERLDAVLMAEQLTIVADYLDSGAWGEDLRLGAFGRDGEEVAARLVGAIALWRNVEPYVGLISPEIDTAINSASEQVLRIVVRHVRRTKVLDPDGDAMTALTPAVSALAAEFRRAAALFSA